MKPKKTQLQLRGYSKGQAVICLMCNTALSLYDRCEMDDSTIICPVYPLMYICCYKETFN